MEMMNKWIKELRITHYLKNCLIFLPAFFGGTITSGSMWKNLLVGFMAYSLGASAVYLMNDIKDVEKEYPYNAELIQILYQAAALDKTEGGLVPMNDDNRARFEALVLSYDQIGKK